MRKPKNNRGALSFLTKKELGCLYLVKKMSQWQIAEKYGVTQGAIIYWMKKWKIKSRKQRDALILLGKSRRWKWEKNPRWSGGKYISHHGYVMLRAPSHALADKRGYVREHRWIWYEAFGSIPKGHHIHHKNGNKQDNRLANLELMTHQDHIQVIPALLKRVAELEEKMRRKENV